MKTIREWFNELPEPYRSQALENVIPNKADKQVLDMADAVDFGLCWIDTPQGNRYWSKLHTSYNTDAPIPKYFTLSDLISFGNFLLSDKRGIDDKFVGDWDIENWKNASK